MKKILFIADGSAVGEDAAKYALHLAKRMQADLVVADWISLFSPSFALQDDTEDEDETRGAYPGSCYLLQITNTLKIDLAARALPESFWPDISIAQRSDCWQNDICFIVTAGEVYYGPTALTVAPKFRKLLTHLAVPVIILPENARIRYPERYVFITDVNVNDCDCLRDLTDLANVSAATVTLTRIESGMPLKPDLATAVAAIMKEKMHTAAYGRMCYRPLACSNGKNDIGCLVESLRPEAIALTYAIGGIFSNTLVCGLEKKITGSLDIPLIVFPER
jgi:hypothetical protein